MAFQELMEGLKLPDGASDRFRCLEALGRMLDGTFYDDLKWSFETEKVPNTSEYIPIRQRRPSVDFNLAYEITQDTQAELFGDEQFPIVQVSENGEANESATKAMAELIEAVNLPATVFDAYEEGVVGGVGIVLRRADDGGPFFEILPAKWCEPVYRSQQTTDLLALIVTYPISRDAAEEMCPGITTEECNKGEETFWYRYIVGPVETIDYRPLGDSDFAHLGEKDKNGETIAFERMRSEPHGFKGRTPGLYTKNLGGKQRELQGPALWWPIRNICIELDYSLSQAGRGLRYTADPMLFYRRGELGSELDSPGGYESADGIEATTRASDGALVKGAPQTLTGGAGSDAKILEINAGGIAEQREFARDLREYALEVVGGMKARAEHLKGAPSGKSLDKGLKPLRRLVRRQRRPYGNGMLLDAIDLLLYGIRMGAIERDRVDANVDAIPDDAKKTCNWPNDETLQGQDLYWHVAGLQLATGGSTTAPKELISPEAIGMKLAADLGEHQSYDSIKGTGELPPEPEPTTPPSTKP